MDANTEFRNAIIGTAVQEIADEGFYPEANNHDGQLWVYGYEDDSENRKPGVKAAFWIKFGDDEQYPVSDYQSKFNGKPLEEILPDTFKLSNRYA